MLMSTTTEFRGRDALLVAAVAVAASILLVPMRSASAQEVDNGDLPETPAEYAAYALQQEPELKALYERWQAARNEAKASESNIPQPRLGYQAFVETWVDNAGITHMGSISQTFPWPGVLEESADPAEKKAEALQHRFEARVLQTVFEVRTILIDIARVDELRAIYREQVAVYDDVRALVEQAMESDEADYGDLLRVNTAREQVVDRLDTLKSRRQQRVADLRDVLLLGPTVELTFDLEGEHDPMDIVETVPDREKLAKSARESHPALKAELARAESRIERAEYARAKRLPWPKVTVGVRSMPDRMAMGEEQRNALMLGFSIPLPIFGAQYDYSYRQFEDEQDAQLAQRANTRSELVAGIDTAVTRIDEKLRRIERYRQELLPLANDATKQMLQKIETGERTVTDYLLSFEQELDLETNVVEFRAAVATERVRLERLTGGEYAAYPDRETPDIDINDARETDTNDE
jgi:outer membrane protein TolC